MRCEQKSVGKRKILRIQKVMTCAPFAIPYQGGLEMNRQQYVAPITNVCPQPIPKRPKAYMLARIRIVIVARACIRRKVFTAKAVADLAYFLIKRIDCRRFRNRWQGDANTQHLGIFTQKALIFFHKTKPPSRSREGGLSSVRMTFPYMYMRHVEKAYAIQLIVPFSGKKCSFT